MGLFGNKSDDRSLPKYFLHDQVGGLSHLLRINRADKKMDQYRDIVFPAYTEPNGDDTYPFCCMGGMYVLMAEDKHKYQIADEFVTEYLPTTPPRLTNTDHQGLLSVLMYRAIVSWVPRGGYDLFFPGPNIRERAEEYVENFWFAMEFLADNYLRSVGAYVQEREPLAGIPARLQAEQLRQLEEWPE